MKLKLNLKVVAGLLASGSLLSAPVIAATASVTCTGVAPADNVALNGCITAAGAGGTCEVNGACIVEPNINLNTADLTLKGIGGASISRNLSLAGGGSTILLLSGASGTTIQDLTIKGRSNGISLGGTPISQPDKVTVRGCTIVAGVKAVGRGIQQFSQNGGPFNDVDRCDPAGPPLGIATDWLIENNNISSTEIALFITGNNNTVRNNNISSPLRCVHTQNNNKSSVSGAFGSAPGNANNTISCNTCTVDGSTASFYPVAFLDLGFTNAPLTPAAPDGCDRGFNDVYSNNCATVQDNGTWGFSTGHQQQRLGNALGSIKIVDSNYSMPAPTKGPAGFNAVQVNFGTKFGVYAYNNSTGAGDYAFSSLLGNEEGNIIDHNKVGLGYVVPASDGFLIVDNGVADTNVYSRNQYCDGQITGSSQILIKNKSGKFCDIIPPGKPAAACSARLPESPCSPNSANFAPEFSLGDPDGEFKTASASSPLRTQTPFIDAADLAYVADGDVAPTEGESGMGGRRR